MKKWGYGLMILALLGYGAAHVKLQADGAATPDTVVKEGARNAPAADVRTLHVSRDQVYKGALLLVNKDHPVPEHDEDAGAAVLLYRHPELLKGFTLLDHSVRLSPGLAERFSVMAEAAAKDGVDHFMISSGYRDKSKQDQLYRQMGAEKAMPAGYSEHNLGLSLDIGSTLGEMSHAPEGQWLKQNAWKYGFILRYPEDKSAITGIQYEPWHFRYVGLPHSAIMQQHGFVLEQYLDYLKEVHTLTVSVEGQSYTVSYAAVGSGTTVQVPADGQYEISGDNMDGVIVTVRS
ncbi:M15 family metallopeptidase [Paenibacillus humicola]|uniref:M15 family metallopeptidase n=1 Tax=Paenibacillus humicola TaxID=3110540 RepID=UPI00237B7390|nr:M15 family metallopeptidase [Paenibacillus humicola]